MPTTPPTFVALDVLEADQLNQLGDGIVELQAVAEGVTFSGASEAFSRFRFHQRKAS